MTQGISGAGGSQKPEFYQPQDQNPLQELNTLVQQVLFSPQPNNDIALSQAKSLIDQMVANPAYKKDQSTLESIKSELETYTGYSNQMAEVMRELCDVPMSSPEYIKLMEQHASLENKMMPMQENILSQMQQLGA